MVRKNVKVSIKDCLFCGSKTIQVKEWYSERTGKIVKHKVVDGGILVGTTSSAQSPVCNDCWGKAVDYLKENYDPLNSLFVRSK